ncbi:1,6-anhydro-N-acetylmuramyl-L-alanine amidase AmpD [Snodgrassella sp. CFCC 13594]|uniref:1,6-anhydro-N-acetylmuramyl-L-alanine amidase AmpD n=1 Tax=Snodgrassella sp. CFCC 13594 TaxID=1775559 RepID=UPI00082E1CDB|nr:1,6-anhydro-N-acetylmuramyl-L-alanine amidase AmpD [Snodgrassella sp. CFCC 13594]
MAWEKGWLQEIGCQWLPSPNFDVRNRAELPYLVVIHNISLPPFEFGSGAVQRLFANRITADEPDVFMRALSDLHVSSHFFIERTGAVYQFVSCENAAYHAGVSRFRGRTGCNAFSIGIELEGCDFEPFEEAQYQALLNLLKQICSEYPIEAVAGHQHIAPGRKSDPGHFFNWHRLVQANMPVNCLYQYD